MQIITIIFSAILFFTAIYALVIFVIVIRNMWNRAVHPWKALSVVFIATIIFISSLITAAVSTNKMSQASTDNKGGNILNFSSSKNSQNSNTNTSSSKSINKDNLYGN